MPAQTLGQLQLASSLFTWWTDTFSSDTPTVFPGVPSDTRALDAWIELWVNAWSRRPHRASSPPLVDVLITAHLFARDTTDRSRLLRLADAVQQTLEHQCVPLHDYDSSDSPLVGYLTLLEPRHRDLTRDEHNQQRPLDHAVILCPGLAHSL